jgi:hypothetical protein
MDAPQHFIVPEELTILEDFIKRHWPRVEGSHFETMIDILVMTTLRKQLNIPHLINDLRTGIIQESFYTENNGNIYYYLTDQKYKAFAERLVDIVVGGNGGMASVGKGEWLMSLCSGINPETEKPFVDIIKNGRGDLKLPDRTEEVKWNGGKVCVGVPGKDVQKKFNTMSGIEDKEWVPFRQKDKLEYSEEQTKKNNATYWKSISGEEMDKLTDNELKLKIIIMSFEKQFKKCDSFIMFNDDGMFQRFHTIEEVTTYYSDKLHLLKGTKNGFECRAKQTNPIALYCYVF